ncbi:MAG: hypothetical protein KAR84_07905, partial [Elusimicrobiales bacterium]|nr:hypothetical protein [Elusimicrobiales bacterium]
MNIPRVKVTLKSCLAAFWLVFSFACFSFATNLNPVTVSISTGSANFSWDADTGNYTAVISTVASFAPYISSGTLSANSTSYADLNPNIIYYFAIKNTIEAVYEEISTTTYARAPLSPEFISNFFTAISSGEATVNINWDVNGNPEYTDY